MDPSELDAYLADCRELTLQEIGDIVPRNSRYHGVLYDLMLDYPLRAAKALRPALCIATCRALGGPLEAVLRSAAAIELYHNAFLIHDDVEDGSERRRDQPTLHRAFGAPIAVNVGDAMLALSLQPLLDNMRLVGLGKALRILQVVARMARESTEGQALELDWIRQRYWQLQDADYVRMVYKKTSWYTFIAPMLIGGIIAGATHQQLVALRKFAALLGVAFQAQDDVLNLVGETSAYGKEIAGDLWEGKHTLIVMHLMRAASPRERDQMRRILTKRRPQPVSNHDRVGGHTQREEEATTALPTLLRTLRAQGEISSRACRAIAIALERSATNGMPTKTPADIRTLTRLIERYGSIEHTREVAQRFARRADAILERADWLAPSVHRDFLHALVGFVVSRNR
jgi:geranylgeranyl diphosphate synthase type II